MFQSLLSQGISLLGIYGDPVQYEQEGGDRFNPFLVRASVY